MPRLPQEVQHSVADSAVERAWPWPGPAQERVRGRSVEAAALAQVAGAWPEQEALAACLDRRN